jgi:hypothetical protein
MSDVIGIRPSAMEGMERLGCPLFRLRRRIGHISPLRPLSPSPVRNWRDGPIHRALVDHGVNRRGDHIRFDAACRL